MPHLAFTLVSAFLLSVATALLGRRPFSERVYVAAYSFFYCAVSLFAGSWAMRLIHG
jgi:hypothetical protein